MPRSKRDPLSEIDSAQGKNPGNRIREESNEVVVCTVPFLENLIEERSENIAAQKIATASKKRKSTSDEVDSQKPQKATRKASTRDNDNELDVSSIHLDGEETHSVEIYDTCNMMRTKINAFLKKYPSETKSSLTRRLTNMPHGKNVSVRSLTQFLQKNGYDRGNTSEAFYGAYVFFEKLRIKQGKNKSKDRFEMERLWGYKGGFNITTASNNKGLLLRSTDRWLKPNKYGEKAIQGADGRIKTSGVF